MDHAPPRTNTATDSGRLRQRAMVVGADSLRLRLRYRGCEGPVAALRNRRRNARVRSSASGAGTGVNAPARGRAQRSGECGQIFAPVRTWFLPERLLDE